MKERTINEMFLYFSNRIDGMNISKKDKATIIGMAAALMSKCLAEIEDISRQQAVLASYIYADREKAEEDTK